MFKLLTQAELDTLGSSSCYIYKVTGYIRNATECPKFQYRTRYLPKPTSNKAIGINANSNLIDLEENANT